MSVEVNRLSILFKPNTKRVITRFFNPGEDRTIELFKKIMKMNDNYVEKVLNQVLRDFSMRHRNIIKIFENNYNKVKHLLNNIGVDPETLSNYRKYLIGSYYTMEYSVESAAYFNPSMVEHPDQSFLGDGQKRVIVSFRATGEGHISSIVFRNGIIFKNGDITFQNVGYLDEVPKIVKRFVYNKTDFNAKLTEMEINKKVADLVLNELNENFIYGELIGSIDKAQKEKKISKSLNKTLQEIRWLADSHYEIIFSEDLALGGRVIFPISYNEVKGIEDARFVKFVDDDGTTKFYATYTAYDGFSILPKLLETEDFVKFKVSPLNGASAHNKGVALFPRKINGKYAMVARCDGVNNYIMYSDNIKLWHTSKKIQAPSEFWELTQIGNCGSPIETKEGWILLTHGVGPMRKYCISAVLLDLNNPEKVIGRLKSPLIMPNDDEREGYVPNVVYSCGGLDHNGILYIPYAVSDWASTIATVKLDDLLDELIASKDYI